TVDVARSRFGRILVDAHGRTLYDFPRDCALAALRRPRRAGARGLRRVRRARPALCRPGTPDVFQRALRAPHRIRSQPAAPVQGDFEMKTRLHIVTVAVCAVSALGVPVAQAELQAQLVSENGSFVLAQAHSSSSTLSAMQKAGTSYHATAKAKRGHSRPSHV